mgnify:CR=1 FL=1
MDPFIHFIYLQCANLCHQLPDRTLVLAERALPLCARCTGIYTGVFFGLARLIIKTGLRGGWIPDRRYLIFLIFSGVCFFLDVLAGIYVETNLSRILSGFMFGFAAISAAWSVMNKNFLRTDRQILLPLSKGDVLSVLMGLSLTLIFVILLPQFIFVYYLFFVSETLGVVIIYGCANAVMLLAIFDRFRNRGYQYRQYAILFVSGLMCFVFEMAAINYFSII